MSSSRRNVESMKGIRVSSIWVVPFIAIVVAAWMVYQNWISQGPEITLVATNADGLEAGTTKVKARNVDVGTVTSIELSPNYENAVIRVQMNQGTERMLHKDSEFWVVKPRIGREGVSGLGTLLSGAYIDMKPGEKGEFTDHFSILDQPPLSTSSDKGIRIELFSTDSSKLEVGSLVHFRGYEVGYIEKVGFDTEKGAITYRAVIRPPYDSLVNSAVQFWITPGLSLKSSARGIEVRLDSLETLLSGGISFGLTQGQSPGEPVEDLTRFQLFASKDEATNHYYNKFINYVFLFESSISGLEVGAPVEFRGIRIGTVQQVPFSGISIDAITKLSKPVIPVLARIEPQRLEKIGSDNDALNKWHRLIDDRIEHGLRASLKISNLLTGAKIINVDFVPEAAAPKSLEFAGYPIFPTVPDSFSNLEEKINVILNKLADLPLKEGVESISQTLQETNKTLLSIQQISHSLNALIKQDDTQKLPSDMAKMIKELTQTLETYQANGQIGGPLRENMASLERALNELQPLLRQLRENPSTLIFDTKTKPDLQPRAAK